MGVRFMPVCAQYASGAKTLSETGQDRVGMEQMDEGLTNPPATDGARGQNCRDSSSQDPVRGLLPSAPAPG